MKKVQAVEVGPIDTKNMTYMAKIGSPAAPLKGLQWVKGSPVEEFKKGSVYIVEFWATWCGPCRVSIPHLTDVQKNYKDKNVTIIGISNEPAEKVKPYVEKMADKMNYNVAIDSNLTATQLYMEAYGEEGIPTAFIVDQNSAVVWRGHPLGDLDKVLEQVVTRTFDMEKYAKELAEKQAMYERVIKNGTAYFRTLSSESKEKARKFADELMKDADAPILNDFAWQILMGVDKSKRDYFVALQAAAKANELTEGKDPMILDTYALSLFESALWQVQEAVKTEKRALELVGDNEQVKSAFKKAIDRYEAASKKIIE
jgi:thiol-disulfide isomerase/thioredoxin